MTLVRAVLGAALLIPLCASTALAAGTVSGQITDSVTQAGIAGAKVLFYDFSDGDGDNVITATADGNGNYSQNLPDGTYVAVTQNTQGYINKIWNNISCSATCDVDSISPVVVSGGTTTGIDFALTPGGGRIAGTITSSATGNPIAGALVFFIDGGGNFPFSTATTDSLGHYVSDGGTDTGNVFVITSNGQGYQDESYNNHKCTIETCDTADPVAVTLGATTNGIDFALDPGGRISGTVRDIDNSPLAMVNVQVIDSTGEMIDEVLTDASGAFITSGLPSGTYYVGTDNSVGLVDYVWNGLLCASGFCDQTQGTPVSVTVPSTTSGITFVLTPGQTISGTVTAAAGGAPLEEVFVAINSASGASVGGAVTDASGHFTTGALPPGTYNASAFMNGYVSQLYNNISCSTCPPSRGTSIVVSNQPVTNINFSMLLATGTGTITGTVTDALNGSLPSGLQVQLFTASGGSVASVNTGSGELAGVYTFPTVAPGSYYVRTNAPSGGIPFINQIYNGVTCLNCGIIGSGGNLVTVSGGSTTSNINFALQRGGVITGTITAAANGALLQNIGAQVFNSAGVSVGTFNTNAQGVYTTIGLPPDTYYVRTANTQGYVNQLWQGQSCPQAGCIVTSGTPVAVNGATVNGINFALTLGGRISGRVTDASNAQALSFLQVQVFSSSGVSLGTVNTDNSGNYTTSGLPAGNYYVRTATLPIFQNNQMLVFVDQLYNAIQCVPACLNPTAGTAVTAATGATTTNINFALSRGGSIAGSVIDAATGIGLGTVGVQIYTSAGVFAKAITTNPNGGYMVAGLPPGSYYARTSMPRSMFYKDALYQGMSCSSGCSVTTGTPINVQADKISNGIDFALSAGAGGISGTITDARTGAPLPNVSVQIYTASGVFTKAAFTNLAGMYGTSGLAPGVYYARTFQDIPTGHANELYGGARCASNCTVTNGTPITVNAGATTIGIDFALGGTATTKGDFDADGKTDIAVWRTSDGVWYILNSSNGSPTVQQWGAGFAPYNDISVPGDYDGDGKIDIAVWRASDGVWYVINSSNSSVTARQWGAGFAPYNDVPVPGDYDGDGKTDIAVWRASEGIWYIINSSNSSLTVRLWGAGFAPFNDVPVPGDYDGDGKTDIAVWRASDGVWYILNSSNGSPTVQQWGAGFAPYNDVPVPGDYDGDGKSDIAVWRASDGVWYIVNSSNGSVTARQWGAGFAPYNDVAVPGDYDGDGKTDIAVWRASEGIWYIVNSSNSSVTARLWGSGFAPFNDVAIPSKGIR